MEGSHRHNGATAPIPQAAPEPDDLHDEAERFACQVRSGMMALRTLLEGWSDLHSERMPFQAGDVDLYASLRFIADGLEALANRLSDRLDERVAEAEPAEVRP
jgi:hypothetical protein